jgi:hypothetical protein
MLNGLFLALALAAASPGPASLAGTWDLTWANRHGATRSGWLVVRQQGARISAEVHGRREVNVSGSIEGGRFVLRGSRLLIPYTIEGRVQGDRLEGVLRAMNVVRHFSARRRPG